MKKISLFFVENDKLTIVLMLGALIYGIMGIKQLRSESFPSVNFATAQIITRYDGASARDIETNITKPIEDEIRAVDGIKDVRSISQIGLSTIVVRLNIDDSSLDIPKTMSDLESAVTRAKGLPNDLREKPSFLELKSEEFPVLELAIVGSNINRKRDRLADLVQEQLEDIKQLKEVRFVGHVKRSFRVNLNPEKMNKFHVSVTEIENAIRIHNKDIPGGKLKSSFGESIIRIEGKIRNATELQNILVRSNFTGNRVYLKDVAEIIDGSEDHVVRAAYNSQEATLLIISKKKGVDTIKLVKDINKKLEVIKKQNPNFKFPIYHNERIKVENKLNVLNSNAVSGLILVVIFLFLFMPGKIGLMSSISLPLTVMTILGMMPALGMNLDAITILALIIAIGMLVDNAVVVGENFTRLRGDGLSTNDALSKTVDDLWLPISATALTTIAAFLPMLVTKGIMGKFIRFIPIVVSISLILNLFEAFIFLPLRLKWVSGSVKLKADSKDWFHGVEEKFERLMKKLIERRYFTTFLFSLIIITSFFLMIKANKFILFPAEQTEMYVARIEMPRGISLEKTSEFANLFSSKIKEKLKEDAKDLVTRAGVSKVFFNDPKAKDGSNVAMISIYVSDHYKFDKSYLEVLKELRSIEYDKKIGKITIEAVVNGPPVGNPIEATFRSNNLKKLDNFIKIVKADLSTHKGVFDLRTDDVLESKKIVIRINNEYVKELGLSLNEVGQTIRSIMSGNRVSNVTLNNKKVDIIVQYDEVFRKKMSDLKDIKVADRRGNLIPLYKLVKFNEDNGGPQIKRFDFKKSKTLLGDIDENTTTQVIVSNELNKILKKYHSKFPEVSVVFGGAAQTTKESMQSLFQALVLSLIGIFALLVFMFRSYLRPLIIMSTIPLGLFGFSVAFFLHGRPISFLALIGIIGLGGIIVNSGIVLISFIDQLKKEEKFESNSSLLAHASSLRLRPVLASSLTTIAGLLPTAYGIGGNDAMLIPMTMAMAWGLTSGTILTIIWVPCAYALIDDLTGFVNRLFKRTKKLELNYSE